MEAKDLVLADVSLGEFLTTKYAIWLHLCTSDDYHLHGLLIENASEGITIQFAKKAEEVGALNIYIYVVMDDQLNIEDGHFVKTCINGDAQGPALLPHSHPLPHH